MRLRAAAAATALVPTLLISAQTKLPIPNVGPAVKFVKAVRAGMVFGDMKNMFPEGTGVGEVFWQRPERGKVEGNTIQFRGSLNGRVVFMREEQRKQLIAQGDAPETYRPSDPLNGVQLQVILSQSHSRERGQRLIAMLSKEFGRPTQIPKFTPRWKEQLGGWTAAWRVNGKTLRLYEFRSEVFETRLEMRFGAAVPIRPVKKQAGSAGRAGPPTSKISW